MATISAVMIIRDEAEVLPLTLPPLVDTLDQVVIVDMRSTDTSREICGSLLRPGDRLVDYDPANLYSFGFEHPRNYGAQYASGQWIFAIDADEFVYPDDLRRLKEWLSTADPAEVNCVIRHNYDGSDAFSLDDLKGLLAGASYAREEQGRFYKNDQAVRWAGLIHEEVWGPQRMAGTVRGSVPLTIHHLSHYKQSGISAEGNRAKTLLYSYLLMKAYRYPGFRAGTNPFWFSTYMSEHKAEVRGYANDLARELELECFDDPAADADASRVPAYDIEV